MQVIYETKEQLIDTLRNDPRIGAYSFVYEAYLDKLVDNKVLDLYKDLDEDIYTKVFFPLICKASSKKDSKEEVIRKQTAFLDKKIKEAKETKNYNKQDVLVTLQELVKLQEKLLQDEHLNNDYPLIAELNLRLLYMLSDETLEIPLQKARKTLINSKNRSNLAQQIFNDLIQDIKKQNKEIDEHSIINSKNNEYEWINQISNKDKILIKHLLITMTSRNYFKEGRLPKYNEIVDGNDFVILTHHFLEDEAEESNSHNMDVRNKEEIRRLDNDFYKALAISTLIVLSHRIKENNIYSSEKQIIINGLDEETKEFIQFIKNNIQNSSLINLGIEKTINNIRNYINILKTTKDIERLNTAFQKWVNSIDLSKLTDAEFNKLDELDHQFIYSRLPLRSRVMYEKRRRQIAISKELNNNQHQEPSIRPKDILLGFEKVDNIVEEADNKFSFLDLDDIELRDKYKKYIQKMPISYSMLPLNELQAYRNYKVFMKANENYEDNLIMYANPAYAEYIMGLCKKNNLEFYPELTIKPFKLYEDFIDYYNRIKLYKELHKNAPISITLLRKYFFDEYSFSRLMKKERDEANAKRMAKFAFEEELLVEERKQEEKEQEKEKEEAAIFNAYFSK